MKKPIIGITMGDPASIGPEISVMDVGRGQGRLPWPGAGPRGSEGKRSGL